MIAPMARTVLTTGARYIEVQSMMKSIAVVLGSYVLSIVLVLATDPLLARVFPNDFAPGHIPSDPALIASTILFAIVSIICAWLCARFAPGNPARHVFWFFVLGEVMGIIFTIPNWSKGWPHWYFLSWLLVWPLSCYIGLLLGRRRAPQLSGSVG
jgi:hypothetical protein